MVLTKDAQNFHIHSFRSFVLKQKKPKTFISDLSHQRKYRHIMVDLIERLDALLKLECVSEDYLSPSFQQRLQVDSDAIETHSLSTASSSTSTSGINEVWREKICEWSYQVIDHYDFSREVVSISIHFLDRYLSTRTVNKRTFQMAAMTTLYLAIKLYEPCTISMKSMMGLSRGCFTVKQMEVMEMGILR